MYLSLSLYLSLSFFWVRSCLWSNISKVTSLWGHSVVLWRLWLLVVTDQPTKGQTRSPIELFWTAKNSQKWKQRQGVPKYFVVFVLAIIFVLLRSLLILTSGSNWLVGQFQLQEALHREFSQGMALQNYHLLGLVSLIPSAALDPLNPPPVFLLWKLKTFRPTYFSVEPNLLSPLSISGFALFSSVTCRINIWLSFNTL